ncbi:MAG: hypothetical protein ACT4OY_04490 [Alphaproteobacteria bacterium]
MNNPATKGKTSLELASAHHVCNVIRRQVLDEFPPVTFDFIVCKSGDEADAFKHKQQDFERHPAGAVLLAHPKIIFPGASGEPSLPVLAIGREKKLLSFMAREKILLSCFIPIDRFDTVDHLRQHALALVWHGLTLLDYMKTGQNNLYRREHDIAKPAFDEKTLAWHNMLADAFSAVFLELQDHKGTIKTLGRQRSLMPLTARKGWQPELYPYPLALDTVEIVYEEISGFLENTGRPMHQALDMTREIGETFDLNAMNQWSVFARAAQEMAWSGTDRNVILGAAIHTSEDPYVRATAYMIAEFLNIEPVLSADPYLYNSFSDAEIGERHHRKACEEVFLSALSQATLRNDAAIFLQAAIKTNENLAQGKPIGWCGFALSCAAQGFRRGAVPVEEARHAFDQACRQIPWQKIQDLNHLIIGARRSGQELNPADLQALAAHSALGFPADAFKVS